MNQLSDENEKILYKIKESLMCNTYDFSNDKTSIDDYIELIEKDLHERYDIKSLEITPDYGENKIHITIVTNGGELYDIRKNLQ